MTGSNGSPASAPREAARSIAELLHGVVTLVELQRRLFIIDLEGALRRARPPVLVLTIGFVLALSCIPVALVGMALFLVECTGWSYAQAFGGTVGAGVLLAGLLIAWGLWRFRGGGGFLQTSATQWAQNLCWLKIMLRGVSHAASPGHGPTVGDGTCAKEFECFR